MNKKLGSYFNGNYSISIYEDGTRIKQTMDDNATEFIADFPDSMDVKITNRCDRNCPMCHEDSHEWGEQGNLLDVKFIDTIRPYTEMAIGGGNPLSHPQLIPFLQILKEKNIIANITVNELHFMQKVNLDLLKYLTVNRLIYGLGVSYNFYNDQFIDTIKQFPNAVVHIINGITQMAAIRLLYNKNLKLLILGYKEFRKGEKYYLDCSYSIDEKKDELYKEFPDLIKHFKVVSFDNLALEQLNVRRLLTRKEWAEFYQGDDGQHTMYIDLVNKKFAINSTTKKTFDLLDNIDDMFSIVKQNII